LPRRVGCSGRWQSNCGGTVRRPPRCPVGPAGPSRPTPGDLGARLPPIPWPRPQW
jgi:hypothetical protein